MPLHNSCFILSFFCHFLSFLPPGYGLIQIYKRNSIHIQMIKYEYKEECLHEIIQPPQIKCLKNGGDQISRC